MNKETQEFLKFVEKALDPAEFSIQSWNKYLNHLPHIYSNDISFRLLFDWHWDLVSNTGRAAFKPSTFSAENPIFAKQIKLIISVGHHLYDLSYQYQELIKYHARCNLKGKSLLEIGGSLPNDLLFDSLQVDSYINIESPDYIEAESGYSYSKSHGEHKKRKTFFCNAEDIDSVVDSSSIDHIFSVACFEHVHDLALALEACFKCSNNGGSLYAYFAPIYSRIDEGDHGVIPVHHKLNKKPIGFHLLTPKDQRQKLIDAGIIDPSEIQEFLGNVNFNRVPNRLLYEDYEIICTESPYAVLELERLDFFNLSKRYVNEFKEVRLSNPQVRNMMTSGFRVHLMKTHMCYADSFS